MALFDPRDFGVDPQGWLSGAFQSLPQMDIAPNEGWPRARNDLAENQRGRDAFLQQQVADYQAKQPQVPQTIWDQPNQAMGFQMPIQAMGFQMPIQAPQAAPQPAPLPMPPQGPQMPPSAMPAGAMVPPAAAPTPIPPGRPVPSFINRVSQQYGLDPQMMQRFMQIESGGNPGNVTGSYKGLFQLSDSEFRKYGSGNIFNPEDNANAAARKLAAESAEFEAKYGRKPTATDLYMVHQQGTAGYDAHMANPNRPAWQNMLSTGEGRERGEQWAKAAIWGNIPDQYKRQFGSVDNVTSQQFVDMWRGKVEEQGGAGMAAGGPQIERASLGSGLPRLGAGVLGTPQQRTPGAIQLGGVTPTGQAPTVGDRIQAAGAGFFNAGSPMQSISNLIGGLITGQRQDPTGIAAQIYNQTQQQTALSQGAAMEYVMGDDSIPTPMKLAMLRNPALAMKYVAELAKPQQPKFSAQTIGNTGYAFNENTGTWTPGVTAPPKPPDAPSGYLWVDPNNPAAGLKPIKDGPATKIEGNTAGYLAMLEASEPGVKEARKYFLSPDFKSGPIDAAGLALGQRLDVGEISRQRRSIELASEAAIRMATGATAPPDEVKRYANFYMPSVYDSEATRRQKLDALQKFMDYAKRNIGQGRMPPPEAFMNGGGDAPSKGNDPLRLR